MMTEIKDLIFAFSKDFLGYYLTRIAMSFSSWIKIFYLLGFSR